MSIPSNILALLSKCTLSEKITILEALQKDIREVENTTDNESITNNSSVDYDTFVTSTDEFIEDENYLMELNEELESLNLFSPQSARPSTMFFGLNNKNHGSSQDLLKYPALCKLRLLVNGHKDVRTELDCCNVVCLSNNKQSIRLHADNEASIDQSHPIATVSLGAMRKVEFVPFGSSYDHTVVTIKAEHNSMYVMRPETQSTLQHRVVRGNIKQPENQVRYSISFRKSKPENSEPIADSFQQGITCSSASILSSDNKAPRIRTTLIVGDSFAARLDPERLSKGRKKVINIAKGGNKIPDVIDSVINFCDNDSSYGLIVDQVFCSVGTNDIRKCRKEGVFKFKGELFKLTRLLKQFFPVAKIFFQSLIPLPITFENSSYIAHNILTFNDMLFEVCKHERVYLLDVFGIFLLGRFRNPRLFPLGFNDIHPNKRGLGLLAREYISRIHCKHFDPLSFN